MQEYRGDVKAVVWELSKFVKTDEGMKIREPFARAFCPRVARNPAALDLQRKNWSRQLTDSAQPGVVHHQSRNPGRSLLPKGGPGVHARFGTDRYRWKQLFL